MHPLPLVVFLTLATGPERTIPEGCREDYGTCREDCTIDYGGSTTKYRQLTECIRRCEQEQRECTDQHHTLRDAQIELQPRHQADPAMREPEEYEKDPPAPASGEEPSRDPVRRGVYRTSNEEAPPKTETAPKPTPQKSSEERSALEEPEPTPAPKPAPKRTEPSRPMPPPEPKKKDISEWDPDGD